MELRHLTLRNYRNYESFSHPFHSGLNIIHGRNAQGKTNLLEAIYMVCGFRPFPGTKNFELVRFGSAACVAKGEIFAGGGLNEVHVTIRKENAGRRVRLNGKAVGRVSQHFGRFKVVAFLPSDMEIVKGSPASRRNYVDSVAGALFPSHLKCLRDYQRALGQRNHLLASGKKASALSIELWDDQMSRSGAEIIRGRIDVIRMLNRGLGQVYGEHVESDRAAAVSYGYSFERGEDMEKALIEAFSRSLAADRKRGHTTVGPHRDRVGLLIDGRDAARFASQGQSKNLVLALKSCEIRLFSECAEVNPILLLDDITSELDMKRKTFLFKTIAEFPGQVFVTSTDRNEIPCREEFRSFLVDSGRASVDS